MNRCWVNTSITHQTNPHGGDVCVSGSAPLSDSGPEDETIASEPFGLHEGSGVNTKGTAEEGRLWWGQKEQQQQERGSEDHR